MRVPKRNWLEEYRYQQWLEGLREYLQQRRENPPKIKPLPFPDLRKKHSS